MKLYSIPLSPFAARVRLSIYFKGLSGIEILPPPEGGTKGEAFLALNPMGQVPTLQLDNDATIPESATILEYLEDLYPEPSLRPADPYDLARARLFLRLPDLNFQGAPRTILGMYRSGSRDQEAFDGAIANIRTALGYCERFIDGADWAVGGKPSLADCALVPVLNVVSAIERVTGVADLISRNPSLLKYWSAVQGNETAAKALRRGHGAP